MIANLEMTSLLSRYDPVTGRIGNAPLVERRLSDLRGSFADVKAYDAALRQGDPLVYSVSAVEPADGEGQLHYGLGMIFPGRIGDEYFLTKGHYHTWRPAAEFYFGLAGRGMMLLEDEATCESRMVPLEVNAAVYVPGHTAHRTVNIGSEPLVYLGVYPAMAGHDYGALAERNFRKMIVEREGAPALVERGQ